MAAIVALNVLVGLIVDATPRNFVEMADLRMMSMRLGYILDNERGFLKTLMKKVEGSGRKEDDNIIEIKRDRFQTGPSTLVSKERIWENILQKERMKKSEKGDINEQNLKYEKLRQDLLEMKGKIGIQKQPQIQDKMASVVEKWRGKGNRAKNKPPKVMQNQSDVQINRPQINSGNAKVPNQTNQNSIESLQEDIKEIKRDIDNIRKDNNEIKNDLKLLIRKIQIQEDNTKIKGGPPGHTATSSFGGSNR